MTKQARAAVKMGRPRGVNINPDAFEDALVKAPGGPFTKSEVCAAANITPSHLSDMIHRSKGASATTVRKLAEVLGVQPGTLAPELTGRFRSVRAGDQDNPAAA